MLYDNKYEEIDVGYFNGTEEKENLGIIEELQFILPHIYKFIITELPKTLCLCTLIFVFFKKTTNFLSHNKKFIHS